MNCKRRGRRPAVAAAVLLAACSLSASAGPAAAPAPRTILDLQDFKRSTHAWFQDESTAGTGTATLVELNPRINAWYLLSLEWNRPFRNDSYHLENPDPRGLRVTLTTNGLSLISDGHAWNCPLWQKQPTALDQARRTGLPYAPVCGGHLYLRNRVAGARTQIERITDFLRDHVWGGDRLVSFVRQEFFQDAFIETSSPGTAAPSGNIEPADAPAPAKLDPQAEAASIAATDLGIDIGDVRALQPGRWIAIANVPGAFLSAIQPQAIDAGLLHRSQDKVNELDSVESGAVDYLVAFDLAQFDLGYSLGTDHPRVDWSERTIDTVRDPALPGPDGIGDVAPMVTNGMLSPARFPRVTATFTGGFKREHGAFHYGDLARVNSGSHYGFVEEGTVFSRLQPGLATVYVLSDGSVGMKTWTKQDDELLPDIKDARQNGVPLIEYDAATGRSAPGALVANWGAGNWSGSDDEKLRTLRAGICLQQSAARSFLIYGYFSTATPSAMARVFQAYGCRYAMHLDMNALEHTYLAVYARKQGEIEVQHLIDGMAVIDRKGGNALAPRFLGFPDDRDFFYVLRREPQP